MRLSLHLDAHERSVTSHSAGHGRSNVMLCAAMVAEGTASNFKEAHSIVRRARPKYAYKSPILWCSSHGMTQHALHILR
jgi:protein-tyrosine phosphatase